MVHIKKIFKKKKKRASFFENGSFWLLSWEGNVRSIGREGPSYINVFLFWDSLPHFPPSHRITTCMRVYLGVRTVVFIQISRPEETLTTLLSCSPIFLVSKQRTVHCYWMFTGSLQSLQLCSGCRQNLDKKSLPDEQIDNFGRACVV